MDTEKCAVLLRVLEWGSLSEAAERLGYTPSGVSRMMLAMEEELGFPLLIRKHKGVLPTEACKALLPGLRQMAMVGEGLRQNAEEIKGLHVGEVRVGSAYHYYCAKIAKTIYQFKLKYPDIRVEYEEDLSTRLVQKLQRNDVNLCIVSKRAGEYDWYPLQEDPIVAWVPAGHPCIDWGVYPLKRLEEDAFIDYYSEDDTDVRRVLNTYGIRANIIYSTTSNYTSFQMVEAGLGVALTNGIYAKEYQGRVQALPVEPAVTIPIGIAVLKTEYLSPAEKAFFSALIEHI